MELCISRALSSVPHHSSFAAAAPLRSHSRTSLSLKRAEVGSRARLYSRNHHLVRAAASDEASTSINSESEVADTGVVAVEESPAEKRSFFYNKVEESAADRPSLSYEVKESATEKEIRKDEPLSGEKSELFELLEQYNIKLDSVDPTVLIYGSTSLFALWIASAVVGAIDAIPLLPKVLELVGLGYSVWFSYRYLIFKENRGEVLAKIDELKKEIIGDD
ncbi:hypothetical protein Scep_020395 [Stephania cephalantha]|uniref:Cyanobacterial aminoacyl-tRNA synthetase CAAD domain-containing protein n=1 Tax=Stephania cephalantha TaxID=152367 RepID=A0AAP0IDM5_9MAGN